MEFELLDGYLLEGKPPKAHVVKRLLAQPPTVAAARPFLEGMRMLGARTPDHALIAFRLVLAGKAADDRSVIELKKLCEIARSAAPDAPAAAARFRALVSP